MLNCGDARAAPTLERALREKRSHGEDGPNVAAVLNDLGIASGEEERFREALEIYTHRKMLETKDAACARLNLGNALCRRGRYRESKHEYERALSVLSQMHPGNDADVAKALGNLGVVSDYDKKYDEAIDYHKRALHMQRAVFGRDAVTSDVANSHENLGVALGHRGDYVEAERHLLLRVGRFGTAGFGKCPASRAYKPVAVIYRGALKMFVCPFWKVFIFPTIGQNGLVRSHCISSLR